MYASYYAYQCALCCTENWDTAISMATCSVSLWLIPPSGLPSTRYNTTTHRNCLYTSLDREVSKWTGSLFTINYAQGQINNPTHAQTCIHVRTHKHTHTHTHTHTHALEYTKTHLKTYTHTSLNTTIKRTRPFKHEICTY